MGCGPGQSARVYIGGVEWTNVSIAGSWTPRLNRPAQAQVTIPMEYNAGDCGDLLKITLDDGEIVFHGPILNIETDTGKDGGTTVYNAQDHMELWKWRPVRSNDGDFTKPVGSLIAGQDLFFDHTYAPDIVQGMLSNSISNSGPNGGNPPEDAEGPIFLNITSITSGGAIIKGAPVDWPMTIADLFSLLVSTGQVDAIITYTDPGGGVTGNLDLYPGNYGTDVSGSVTFEYGTGARTISDVRWNRDMSQLVNKYWLFGGPRVETAADAAGDQHWCFNITGTDGGQIAGYPGTPNGLAYPPGGQSVDTTNDPNFGVHSADDGWTLNPLGHKIYDSRQAYGVRMKIDVFDGYDDDCIPGFGTPGRSLYRYQWQIFSWFSADPREIVHIQPADDTFVGCFGIGDLIGIDITSDVKGGISGTQRVYQYTVSWEATPSVLTLSEIQTSSDGETEF